MVRRRDILTLTSALLAGCTLVAAEEVPIPAVHQIPIFLKVLTYDRALEESDAKEISIGVVYAPEDPAAEETRLAVLETLGDKSGKTINGRPFSYESVPFVSAEDLEQVVTEKRYDVLYVTCGNADNLTHITDISQRHDILTISGVAEYAAAGIAVTLSVDGGKPRIVINLPSCRDEGRDFRAKLLQLCKVLK